MKDKTEWPCWIQKSKGRLSASSSWGCWLDRLPFAPSLPARARKHVGHTQVCIKGSHISCGYSQQVLWLLMFRYSCIEIKWMLMLSNFSTVQTWTRLFFFDISVLVWRSGRCLFGAYLVAFDIKPVTGNPSWGHRSWLGSKLAKYRAPRNSGKFREWSGVQDLLLLGQIWSDLYDQICFQPFRKGCEQVYWYSMV